MEPLKKRYCQGTDLASSIKRTTKAPKDQNIPAIKTNKIAESNTIPLSIGGDHLMNVLVAILLFLHYSVLFSILATDV